MALVVLGVTIANRESATAVGLVGAAVVLHVARAAEGTVEVDELGALNDEALGAAGGHWGS